MFRGWGLSAVAVGGAFRPAIKDGHQFRRFGFHGAGAEELVFELVDGGLKILAMGGRQVEAMVGP